MKAIIMAGGFGTRIQPLTSSLPKPMLPLLNKPMMELVLLKLKEIGIFDIVILLFFKPEIIKNYFGDGSKFGVKINYVLPEKDYGTAGAVKHAENFIGNDNFIIISGDLVTTFDLNEVIGFHEVKKSFATICLTRVDDPVQFGVVITNKEHKIVKFLEKPGWGEVFSDTINTGIYIFNPEIFKYIPSNINYDFSKDLFPDLMNRNIDIFGFISKGYWRDVGNPSSYRDVFTDIFKGKINLDIEFKNIPNSKAYISSGGNCTFPSNSIAGKVFFGSNVTVAQKSYILDSSIGNHVKIEKNVVIENSILWDNIVIKEGSILKNCVICNNVIIGKNVNISKGSIIAENTEIGNNVIFEKDIMVWPNKLIEEDSILSSNVIWGDKWKKSIFEGGKVSARTNIELSPELVSKLGAALGSVLPKNASVIVSRDYHNASRMLKRSFLGGLLSTGVTVYDLTVSTIPAGKWLLKKNNINMFVYFRQSILSSSYTEIFFYDSSGLHIDSLFEKSIENIYYRENFRRTSFEDIGKLIDIPFSLNEYRDDIFKSIDTNIIKNNNFSVVVDMFNGSGSNSFPHILSSVGVTPVVLNAYFDESKLSRSLHSIDISLDHVSKIVKALNSELGFIVYQSCSRLQIFTDEGIPLKNDSTIMAFLKLLDLTSHRPVKVYLPITMPTIFDDKLKNINIVRGRSGRLKQQFMKDFDFIGLDSSILIFPAHALWSDAIFTALKMIELLAKSGLKLSQIIKTLPEYYYAHNVINCPVEKKGLIMRNMSEDALDKDASYIDGVKIKFSNNSWVLMLPDQFSPNVHLYVEAGSDSEKDELLKEYIEKINLWIS